MLANPLVHVGASDGGAHIPSFATYGDTGYLFSEFVRETRHLSLEHAVKKITADTARDLGPDESRLAEARATPPTSSSSTRSASPAATNARSSTCRESGMRYVRNGVGVDTVIVNGEIAYRNDAYTESRTGIVCT